METENAVPRSRNRPTMAVRGLSSFKKKIPCSLRPQIPLPRPNSMPLDVFPWVGCRCPTALEVQGFAGIVGGRCLASHSDLAEARALAFRTGVPRACPEKVGNISTPHRKSAKAKNSAHIRRSWNLYYCYIRYANPIVSIHPCCSNHPQPCPSPPSI